MAINEDNLIATILKTSLLLSCVLALCGWLLFSEKIGYSILAGGFLATANFIWMKSMLVRVIYCPPSDPSRYAQIRLVLRLAIVAVILYFAITSGLFSILGLIVGLSVIVINIIAFTLYLLLGPGG